MAEAVFFAPTANTRRAAVEGTIDLPDSSEVTWAMSRREFGPMSFKGRPDWDITHNRMSFLRLFNLKIDKVVAPQLVHGNNVEVVTEKDVRKGAREMHTGIPDTDGLVTQDANVILFTTHADCPSVWLVAPESGWIGLAHSGWQGLLNGVVDNLILAIPESDRNNLKLGIGPGISAQNYEIGEEVAEKFRSHETLRSALVENDDKIYLDLQKGIRLIGESHGTIVDSSPWLCTHENEFLSSYRRDGENFAPMGAFITRIKV
ncbi:polyphenol oxidase family protein [bacterium]|nr:polyphenol oxidase family protein [bacterium]